ncbi:hypothetical protein GN244_ATG11553 [Phytophthora infestans]|uniref:Uncharacterized protein n=1 Tax=Phytophthora infestans TaxID=4787 RepID=A0A833SNN1_PHYIN|nr:hypothetical protein GN244_ATG11553 [Phytophthora infestans]
MGQMHFGGLHDAHGEPQMSLNVLQVAQENAEESPEATGRMSSCDDGKFDLSFGSRSVSPGDNHGGVAVPDDARSDSVLWLSGTSLVSGDALPCMTFGGVFSSSLSSTQRTFQCSPGCHRCTMSPDDTYMSVK